MTVQQINDGSMLQAVNAAQRTVVLLMNPWSGPANVACLAFRLAAKQTASELLDLSIEFFMLDEEADWCQAWLFSFGLPQLGCGYSLGAGSMLWLKSGHVVSHEVNGHLIKSGGIVARTRWLWARQAKTVDSTDDLN